MSSQFSIVQEEFADDLESVRALIAVLYDQPKPKVRVAAAHSATLLLAAMFEQFVREMARIYAREIVSAARDFKDVPRRLVQTAWRRTIAGLAELDLHASPFAEVNRKAALLKFNSVYAFCGGDKEQDIYEQLIHNENNMRPNQLNMLFSISDLQDLCLQASGKRPMLHHLQESDPGRAHGQVLAYINEFFERRNDIAHALGSKHSTGADQIIKDIDFFLAFSRAVSWTLEEGVGGVQIKTPVDRVFVLNQGGDVIEVHSVPLKIRAGDYLKRLQKRAREEGRSLRFKIELKDGGEFPVG